jgi:hypothetical protein
MNTTRYACAQHDISAADALFDQIEQDLLALTIAPLECRTAAPPECVDEFADDFFSCWSTPPGMAPGMAPDAGTERPSAGR